MASEYPGHVECNEAPMYFLATVNLHLCSLVTLLEPFWSLVIPVWPRLGASWRAFRVPGPWASLVSATLFWPLFLGPWSPCPSLVPWSWVPGPWIWPRAPGSWFRVAVPGVAGAVPGALGLPMWLSGCLRAKRLPQGLWGCPGVLGVTPWVSGLAQGFGVAQDLGFAARL